jgi:hypothetical protein
VKLLAVVHIMLPLGIAYAYDPLGHYIPLTVLALLCGWMARGMYNVGEPK